MNRFLSLLVGGMGAIAVTWGCSSNQPLSDDDSVSPGSGNRGAQGGTSSGGTTGSGSGGTLSGTGGSGATCGAGLTSCNGACVNLTNDAQHCGSCATVCPSGSVCANSGCSCANGTTCPGGQVCTNNVCGCPAGQSLCAATGSCTAPTACTGGGTGGAGGTGGGTPTGGSAGMVASGGMGTGGDVAMGGMGAVAGSAAGGSAGTGGGMVPAGYWTYKDWHGCAWTGIDTDTTATTRTTIMPKDFTAGVTDGSYCVNGAVGNTWASVALLGFNLNQPADGTSCVYDPAAATADGPPGVVLSQTGLAVNFSKTGAFTLRVQVQAQDGATNENHRWCATIKDAAGPVFVKYSDFYTQCWNVDQHPDDMSMWGTQYDTTVPISAVVFLTPGVMDATTPYNFCINGFAAGNSAADAPTGGMQGGPLTGTIGGSGSTDLDFQRVKVKVDGHSYIIQNNNWGSPSTTDQTLSYSDNSFSVTKATGSGNSAPASFPSIYIGANGDTQSGLYDTSSDDHLPKQISAITSVNTSFGYTVAGNMNAAYDIWFASSPPSACYGDGISGFVMLWFHSPSGFHPIGSSMATANIGGHNWDVWVGQRGSTGSSNGTCQVNNSSAPVVSYVSKDGDINNVSNLDLKPFFTDAASHGISSSWYLTDVFGGMEIWSGAPGAAVTKFTAVVSP